MRRSSPSRRSSSEGPIAFIASGLVWLPLAAAAFVRVAGRSGRRVGGNRRPTSEPAEPPARPSSGSRVEKPRPAGTLALPGDAASMRLHVDQASGAVMIHDPHRQTLCAVLSVSHPAFALLDDSDRSLRVSRWGRVIAQLAHSGTCAALQVLEATIPDPARSQSEWWETHGSNDGGWAATQYQALLDQVRLDSSTHRTTISLSLDLRAAARAIKAAGRGVRGAAEVLRGDMAALTDALRQAGLRPVGWLGEAELAAIVRQAFEPSVEIDPTSDPAANLSHAGPVAVRSPGTDCVTTLPGPAFSGYRNGPASPCRPTSCTHLCSPPVCAERSRSRRARSRPTRHCARSAGKRPRRWPTLHRRPGSASSPISPTPRSTTT